MSTAVVTGFCAWLIALLASVAHDVANMPPVDPIRYCYTIKADQPMPDGSAGVVDQPWSCYLEADRPKGYTPIWVGPESEVRTAVIEGDAP